MSKILVVEPHRMLQQAIGLSLFPEHEVTFADALPHRNAAEISGYDAVVLDAAALREKNAFSPEAARAIQRWKIPMIWLETGDGPVAPSRQTCVVLQRPVAKERLLAALADCLGVARAKRVENASTVAREPSRVSLVSANGPSKPHIDEARIIELVDVVEEPALENTEDALTKK
jgi:hypothetical protein